MKTEDEGSLSVARLWEAVYAPQWADQAWREVLIQFAGTLDAAVPGQIVERLLAQPEDGLRRNPMLAAACLAGHRHPEHASQACAKGWGRLQHCLGFHLTWHYKNYGSEPGQVRRVRAQAVYALARLTPARAPRENWLAGLWKDHDDPIIRRAAVETSRLGC